MNNIWNDSYCIVEEEYNSSSSVNSLNHTNQFKNVLVNNKGNIRRSETQCVEHQCFGDANDTVMENLGNIIQSARETKAKTPKASLITSHQKIAEREKI